MPGYTEWRRAIGYIDSETMINALSDRCSLLTLVFGLALGVLWQTTLLEAQTRSPWNDSKIVGSPNPPKPMIMVGSIFKASVQQSDADRWQPDLKRYFRGSFKGRVVSFDPAEEVEQFDIAIELRKDCNWLRYRKVLGNERALWDGVRSRLRPQSLRVSVLRSRSKTADGVPNGTRLSRFKVIGDSNQRLICQRNHSPRVARRRT